MKRSIRGDIVSWNLVLGYRQLELGVSGKIAGRETTSDSFCFEINNVLLNRTSAVFVVCDWTRMKG